MARSLGDGPRGACSVRPQAQLLLIPSTQRPVQRIRKANLHIRTKASPTATGFGGSISRDSIQLYRVWRVTPIREATPAVLNVFFIATAVR